jgi:uncharacterized membrane protein
MSTPPGEGKPTEPTGHALYLEERKLLIDAARESARTFDKAALAFGSAAFGASVALLKDVVPRPSADSLSWLRISWLCFSLGILVIMLSFLFSHRACLFEIERAYDAVTEPESAQAKQNRWADATHICNGLCVALLFAGIVLWGHFAIINLKHPENTAMSETVKKGYVPPQPARPQPSQQPSQPPQQQPKPKQGK